MREYRECDVASVWRRVALLWRSTRAGAMDLALRVDEVKSRVPASARADVDTSSE